MNQQSHPGEEQLILHYYGEAESAVTAAHLASCEQCRAEYRQLQVLLNSVDALPVPARGEGYGAKVWEAIAPKLGGGRKWRFIPQRWVAAGVMASLLAIAFYAGRMTHPARQEAQLASGPIRERILMVAVGDHLERSQMVLIELVNSDSSRPVDISAERDVAESLLRENRLYRQTAEVNGDSRVAAVLEDLERVLLEIAHSPELVDGDQIEDIRSRIENQALLFRVRVIESQLRQMEQQPLGNMKGEI